MVSAATIMIQGTASSVGKSALVTALCRIFAQDGLRVAPFKSQNMALNSAVTVDGGEIGRAQAEQAAAAGIEPTVDMNPILLKPEADAHAQLVVMGRPYASLSARDYEGRKKQLLGVIRDSLDRLRAAYDVIVIEGAGSPAEINLRENEIVNMRVAALADAPVLLVGDIDRGGVFASLVGTLELLEPEERGRVAGLVINKFRGDVSLMRSGLDFLEAKTGKPVLGVVPFLRDIGLAEEDSVALDVRARASDAAGLLDVAVIRLPHISNYDDYDPLKPETSLRFVERAADLAAPDLIILPGTKSTVADLSWVRESGLAAAIEARLAEGVPVIGICGGYQMLGKTIRDPLGVETLAGEAAGLRLLDITTAFAAEKQTVRVRGEAAAGEGLLAASAGQPFAGYEIHHGVTMTGEASGWLRITERGGERVSLVDGAVRADGMVAGCYIHGLFDSDAFRAALLGAIGRQRGRRLAFARFGRGAAFDRLAAHVRVHLDIPAIYRLLGRPG